MRTTGQWVRSISAIVVLLSAIVVAAYAITGGWDRAAVKLEAPRKVTLYTSVDDPIARAVAERFRVDMGIIVEIVGDTEATKTTGLVMRLESEKDAPRADVWWSSEPVGTIRLARQGILEPMTSPPFNVDTKEAWPAEYKAADGTWHAIALRARAIAFNTKWVTQREAPRSLTDLLNPRWKGRVGLARPQFGTTRTHMAAILSLHGPDALRSWLEGLKANQVRLYDGNSAVARGLGMGEIDIGLTDTDDVWAAQRNVWPVALNYERHDGMTSTAGKEAPGGAIRQAGSSTAGMQSLGPLAIPNTVSIVKGSPHPREARLLAEYLLSEATERMLLEMEQHTVPVRPWLMQSESSKQYEIPSPARVDWEKIADSVPEAIKICEQVLGG
ncbi:MAG TPA: extracellular solute-binding protein [Phycisphaerales bacterium]|nr:extracellular solute-binding protein [Phycisphaerales bacterium]